MGTLPFQVYTFLLFGYIHQAITAILFWAHLML